MNRLEAEKYLGKRIWIDKNKDGEYTGELVKIHAPKGKPWSGTIRIKTIESCPDIDGSSGLKEPLYSENDEVTLTGSLLSPMDEKHSSVTHTFEESHVLALVEQAETIKGHLETNAQILEQIYSRLSELDQNIIESLVQQNDSSDYEEFELKRIDDLYVCENKQSGQILLIDFLPIHAAIKEETNTLPLLHKKGFRFLTAENDEIQLAEGQRILIHHQQLDPYLLLKNDLQKESLGVLSKTLSQFGLHHEDVFMCHNAILQMPIDSVSSPFRISGTHFVNFHKNNMHVVLQHHFERTIDENPGYRYDRFELTSNLGQRTVSVYTNDSATNSSYKER